MVAYLMTCTQLDWEMALTAVQARRPQACPNFGFREQLVRYGREAVEVRMMWDLITNPHTYARSSLFPLMNTCTWHILLIF